MVDYMGHHFEFIPFGYGRRILCPALPLASRVLSMTLGSILLAFDWILEDGVEPSEMDMSEHMGATLKKAIPLKALAIPYKGSDPLCRTIDPDLDTMTIRTKIIGPTTCMAMAILRARASFEDN
ncbi:hypothetical protein RHGRI_021400 [Rhododendron griersonianum]|uniref:Cytochrome P450 n=1 Tax=Rhododendron griersonianum TaxID=479676 RepID=A0AAV6JN74_9ERIC|nr:hypothetical protein RHGRI_021400 [Rhododendron griersonianum]